MQLSRPVKRAKPLIDSHQNLNQLKVDESAWVDENWWSNESESCDSHPHLIRPLQGVFKPGFFYCYK